MIICPNCHSGFSRELAVCPECNQSLVDRVEISRPVASAPDDSWVAVASIKGNKAAEKAKRALDASNIPSIIMPKSFLRAHTAPAMGLAALEKTLHFQEKLLMVPKDFKIEARLLVRSALKKDINEI